MVSWNTFSGDETNRAQDEGRDGGFAGGKVGPRAKLKRETEEMLEWTRGSATLTKKITTSNSSLPERDGHGSCEMGTGVSG